MRAGARMRDIFAPFDLTYAAVTDAITARAGKLTSDEKRWLLALVDEFASERVRWNSDQRYGLYLEQFNRLQARILLLAAGAYLHISYDLPRIVADNWPGAAPWDPNPPERRGENVYFELDDVFVDVLASVSTDSRVVGVPVLVFHCIPRRASNVVLQWALRLRAVAWTHARALAHSGTSFRRLREEKMLEAMTAALADVSSWKPWDAALLGPPHVAFRATNFLLMAQVTVVALPASLAAVAALLLVATFFVLRRRREAQVLALLDEFGSRAVEYVSYAVEDPEGLTRYLQRRRNGDAEREPPQRPERS